VFPAHAQRRRHASYLDTHTRQILKDRPELHYAEALMVLLDRFYDDTNFVDKMLDVIDHDPVRFKCDKDDFIAVQIARDETWRRAHGYDVLDKLPPLFD
jgi:hypothetical protein